MQSLCYSYSCTLFSAHFLNAVTKIILGIWDCMTSHPNANVDPASMGRGRQYTPTSKGKHNKYAFARLVRNSLFLLYPVGTYMQAHTQLQKSIQHDQLKFHQHNWRQKLTPAASEHAANIMLQDSRLGGAQIHNDSVNMLKDQCKISFSQRDHEYHGDSWSP